MHSKIQGDQCEVTHTWIPLLLQVACRLGSSSAASRSPQRPALLPLLPTALCPSAGSAWMMLVGWQLVCCAASAERWLTHRCCWCHRCGRHRDRGSYWCEHACISAGSAWMMLAGWRLAFCAALPGRWQTRRCCWCHRYWFELSRGAWLCTKCHNAARLPQQLSPCWHNTCVQGAYQCPSAAQITMWPFCST